MADNLNLTPERGPNVWDKPGEQRERWKSEVGAAVMLAAGAAVAYVGGRRLYRAVRDVREAHQGASRGSAQGTPDIVDRESAQSFPASDSPSWTPTGGANRRLTRSNK